MAANQPVGSADGRRGPKRHARGCYPPAMSEAPYAKLRSEREPPPHFAGRAKELAALRRRLEDLCETGDPGGGMALIVGVPGIGKTQLGRKFAEDAVASEAALDIRRLATDTSMLEHHVDLFLAMARALDAEEEARKVADLDTRSTVRSAGVGVVRGALAREHARHTGGLSALLDAAKHAGVWSGKALILLVDELQTVQPQGMTALRVLHQGDHGCPILLVGIGLQHTQQVLGNPADGSAGISRVVAPIELRSLSETETLEAIEGSMAALGHGISEACAAALARASQGFPQHIHGYLNGALEAIAANGALAPGRSLDDALQAGDRARADYYDARLLMLPNQNAMFPVVRAMRERNRDRLWQEEAVAAVDAASFDGERTVREAIKHGVLSLAGGGVSFGIPSFRDHVDCLLRERIRDA